MPDISLRFPPDLDSNHSPVMLLSAREWTATGKTQRSTKVNRTGNAISLALPLPINGLTETTSHQWEKTESMLVSGAFEGLKKAGLRKVKEAMGTLATWTQFREGELLNDYASLTYGGSDFRNFDFTFSFVPKSESEANVLFEVIKAFKIGSLPQYKGNKIGYPYFWKIRALFPDRGDLLLYKSSVVTNLTHTYFPDNVMTIHPDGTPTHIQMDVSFRELSKIYRSDYE